MVKPNKFQQARLDELRNLVVEIMTDMDVWQNHDLIPLFNLNLGVLRKNATQRHGVTRWKQGVSRNQLTLENIQTIELHPELLHQQWAAYAAFVLHHEFIHALGFREHNALFRSLEHSWPGIDAGDLGPKFTEHLRRKSAKWLWVCEGCKTEFPRKKPSNGGYRCRKCGTVLTDKKL